MNHWMRGKAFRFVTGGLAATAIALLGCSAEDNVQTPASHASAVESNTTPATNRDEIQPQVDPAKRALAEAMTLDATQSIRRAANFLADQSRFRFTADISYDARQEDGRLLEFGARRVITIRRPDAIHIEVSRRDGEKRALYFDGSTLAIDLSDHHAFVSESMPGTIYAALEHLSDNLGIPVPLANLVSENFARPLEQQITSGYYVGDAFIEGHRCEHLAFRLAEVDAQFWIVEGEIPWIAQIVITHKLEPGNPQFRARLRQWDFELETPDSLFQFEPAEGSQKLMVESIFGPNGPSGKEIE